jgi:rubrerythrin
MDFNTYYEDNSGERQMGMIDISGSDLLLVNDIQRAVILEVQAFNYYQRLITLTTNEQQQQIISSIQRDEMMHYHWFTMMLRMMGAPQPLIPPGELPISFPEGVREAIRLELEAAAFYQTIVNRAASHFIRMHTMRAIFDEQRHAALLQNILMSL